MNTLKNAFALINSPFKFIHGNLALDAKDRVVDPHETKAVKFDLLGALTKVHAYISLYEGVECVTYKPSLLEADIDHVVDIAHRIFPKCKGYSLGPINDLLTFDELVELFTILFYLNTDK